MTGTMSATLLLVRHGETAWNREKIFRGAYDIPLNENGRLQASYLARALVPRKIDVAFSSPLSRATETAAIALEPHGITAAVHEGLRDFDYGAWTGLRDEDVAQRWPKEHALWTTQPHAAHPPKGDTLEEVFDRAFATLEEIALRYDSKTVALFAHRVVNKLLLLGALTLGLDRFPFIRQDNCCYNELERTGEGYIVVSLNDTAHIRQGGATLLKTDF
jgi:broad specificity phosphatase PhoE